MLSFADEIANNNDTDLDFTDTSIKELDAMISAISVEFSEEGIRTQQDFINSEGVRGISEALACYLVECIERNYVKGVWIEDPKNGPWPIFIFKNKKELYPFDWVMRKFIEPDNFSLAQVYTQSIDD